MPFVHVEIAVWNENGEKNQFSPLGLQRRLTVLSFRSKIGLKAKICVKFSLREISNLVEFIGPRYSVALSKSYIDTRGVMKRGVSESVMSPILLSWKIRINRGPDTSSAVCQEIYELWFLRISVSQNYVDFRQWGKMARKLKFKKN